MSKGYLFLGVPAGSLDVAMRRVREAPGLLDLLAARVRQDLSRLAQA
jgi:hypothetical protein